MRRALLLSCLLAGACGKGDSIVELSVVTTSGTMLPVVQALEVVATLEYTVPKKPGQAILITVDRTIPPTVDFALRFDPAVNGPVAIKITAVDAEGNQLAEATEIAALAPSRKVSMNFELPGVAPPDMMTPPPDMSPPPACDPVLQTNCGANQKCVASGFCEPNGSVPIGQACKLNQAVNQRDNCVKGATCEGGACRQMCNVNGNCSGPASPVGNQNIARCVDFTSLTPDRCNIPCNPVPQAGPTGCPAGLACRYTRNTQLEFTTCSTPGTAMPGFPCGGGVGCVEGSTCVVGGSTMTTVCRSNCRVGIDDCGTGPSRPTKCFSFGGTGAGALGLGFCCLETGC
jgi:hypothetical protein